MRFSELEIGLTFVCAGIVYQKASEEVADTIENHIVPGRPEKTMSHRLFPETEVEVSPRVSN